jgi:hypothetical protein
MSVILTLRLVAKYANSRNTLIIPRIPVTAGTNRGRDDAPMARPMMVSHQSMSVERL